MKTLAMMAAMVCLGLTSCTKIYYQVYDVNSESLKQEDNSLVYENSDMKVMYNLWGENGKIGFILQNKTDKDLFVDMDKTFFILNGEANDYFKNREYSASMTNAAYFDYGLNKAYSASFGFWPTQYYVLTRSNLNFD